MASQPYTTQQASPTLIIRPALTPIRRHPSLTTYIYTPYPHGRPNNTQRMATTNISKKRKFVADGVFYAELNEVRVRGVLSWTSAVMAQAYS